MTVSDDSEGGSAGGGDTPGPQTILLRNPCPCGCIEGLIFTKNGQDTVRCAQCDRYAGYNAPRTETGAPAGRYARARTSALANVRESFCGTAAPACCATVGKTS